LLLRRRRRPQADEGTSGQLQGVAHSLHILVPNTLCVSLACRHFINIPAAGATPLMAPLPLV
jgi:hypothetical protein